jgi:hypothetical protein
MNENFYRLKPSYINPVYAEILLDKDLIALIDIEDLGTVLTRRWYACPKGSEEKGLFYAATKQDEKQLYLHRLLTDPPEGKCIDHINRNSLDNRRANLRICTQAENVRNHGDVAHRNSSSGVRCVYIKHRGGNTFYMARAESGPRGNTRSISKRFPFTPQGLADAAVAVPILRQSLEAL